MHNHAWTKQQAATTIAMNRIALCCLIAMLWPIPSLAAVESVQIMALFKNRVMVKLDGKQRMLRLGKTSPEGVTLISATSREAVLEVNGKRDTFVLGQHISASYVRNETPVVRIVSDNLGMFRTSGGINGQIVDFLVDTGASVVSMNSQDAKRLGIDYVRHGKQIYVQTASRVERAYAVTLNKVRVGDITLENVEATVLLGNFPVKVLLGMSFLGKLEMKNSGNLLELRKKF